MNTLQILFQDKRHFILGAPDGTTLTVTHDTARRLNSFVPLDPASRVHVVPWYHDYWRVLKGPDLKAMSVNDSPPATVTYDTYEVKMELFRCPGGMLIKVGFCPLDGKWYVSTKKPERPNI